MGERGDIIRTMQRAYTERGTAPAIVDQLIYDPATAERPLVGRVVERGLSDEYADRHYVIVEEIGRAHVELQSLMRISYAVFCLKKKKKQKLIQTIDQQQQTTTQKNTNYIHMKI